MINHCSDRNLIINGDAEYALGADDPAINHGAAGWDDVGAVSMLTYGCRPDYPNAGTPGPDRARAELLRHVGGA